MKKINSSISIIGLELFVHLGWTEPEQIHKQKVLLDVEVKYVQVPRACMSDQLDDTICYSQLITKIFKSVEAKTFKLIEHLTCDIYQTIKPLLARDEKLSVRIHKYPHIKGLSKGVSFSYGDDFSSC